jgi:hypothetical protein
MRIPTMPRTNPAENTFTSCNGGLPTSMPLGIARMSTLSGRATSCRAPRPRHFLNNAANSGQCGSQRSCQPVLSRCGQSAASSRSSSRPDSSGPYFAINLATL